MPLQVDPAMETQTDAMKRTTLIAVTCVALLVTAGLAAAAGGVSAVPGNAPAQADDANESTQSTEAGEHDVESDAAANTSAADDAAERTEQGPPADLSDRVSDRVPEHVSAIHERISAFLNDDLETSLGDAVSDVTPGDDESAENDDVGTDGESDEVDTEHHDDYDESDDGTDDEDESTDSDA